MKCESCRIDFAEIYHIEENFIDDTKELFYHKVTNKCFTNKRICGNKKTP